MNDENKTTKPPRKGPPMPGAPGEKPKDFKLTHLTNKSGTP